MSELREPLLTRVLTYLKKHERHISAAACIVGFILDSSFLPSIDHLFTRIVGVGYFTVAVVLLLLSQAVISGNIHNRLVVRIAPLFPLAVQFVFGGLLSVVFVYYFRSSALAVSWPLLILLGLLFAGNEIWKKRLERLEFQIAVLFILFLFFSIFSVPLFFGTIGTGIFILSVLFSVLMMGVFILLLTIVALDEIRKNALRFFFILATPAIMVVGLYMVNLLPPIPLVTRADGVYHSLSRSAEGDYLASSEQMTWKEKYLPMFYPIVYHRTLGEPVYFYSAVYAPTVLRAPIVHVWQYWSEEKGWQTASRISFPINGGREAGYRGYSQKESIAAGLWRVRVETEDGRTLSRRAFTVVEVNSPSDTTTEVL